MLASKQDFAQLNLHPGILGQPLKNKFSKKLSIDCQLITIVKLALR
jgi:hypothetical protein